MRLHEDCIFQDILFRRDLFSVGLETLDIANDGLSHHFDGFIDSAAVGDTALERGNDGSESPLRFFPQENAVTDRFHEDHPNRIVRRDPSSSLVIIDMAPGIGDSEETKKDHSSESWFPGTLSCSGAPSPRRR